jgi:putative aldouronate transport system substrate-binding protein
MNNKSVFSILAVLAILTGSLSACSPAPTQEAIDKSTATTGAEPKPTLKWLVSSSFYDLEADAGAKITREVSGYNIEFQVISGVEQLMLIISSGESYDYVYLSPANYNLMMNNNALMDITEPLGKYGGNITKSITTLWPATTVNGKIYAIPSTIAQPGSLLNSIVARGDLLDTAGIKVPTTIDGFYETLVAIKKAYPKMIPLTTDAKSGYGGYFVPNLAGAFGITGTWQDVKGTITPIIKHPNLKAYLEYMAKLYKEGLLDVEMPALSSKDKVAKWTSSKSVMMVNGWNGIETAIGALRELEPNMKTAVLPIMIGKDGTQVAEKRSGVGAFGAIPVTSKHPVDSIKALNSIMEMNNFTRIAMGDEGKHYTLNSDGSYKLIQPAFNNERVNSNVFVSGFYREDVYPKMWEARLSKNADLETTFNAFKASIAKIGVDNPVSLAPAVTVVDNMQALDTYVMDALNGIVAGVTPVDQLDKVIAYWDSNGGTKIEKFYNEWRGKK